MDVRLTNLQQIVMLSCQLGPNCEEYLQYIVESLP